MRVQEVLRFSKKIFWKVEKAWIVLSDVTGVHPLSLALLSVHLVPFHFAKVSVYLLHFSSSLYVQFLKLLANGQLVCVFFNLSIFP